MAHLDLQYNNEPLTLNAVSNRPPPDLVWTHGAGNTMATPMNSEFSKGFMQVSSVLGFNRNGRPGVPMFETILGQEPDITNIGGRSAGSVAALQTVLGNYGQQVKHLMLLSFPFSSNYSGSISGALRRIPAHINILFIIGDRDDYGSGIDATWDWIDRNLPNHNVWKIRLRHASHGTNVPEEYGGEDAKHAILRTAGRVTAEWLLDDSKSSYLDREGFIWYDVENDRAYWSGWAKEFDSRMVREWQI